MTRENLPDYMKVGNGETTIYLLHGGYGSKAYWAPVIERYSRQGLRVIAWDAPGYGISELPDKLTIDGMAKAAADLIDATGTRHNVVLGHSMGGLIAPLVANMRKDAVQGIILSATVSSFGHLDDKTRQEFIAERVKPLDDGLSMKDVAGPLIRSMMGKNADSEDARRVIAETSSTPGATFRAAIAAIVSYDADPALAELAAPTLIIVGEVDPIGKVDNLKALHDQLEGSEFCVVPGCGHYAWAEDPETYDAAVLSFVRRVTRT